MRVWSYGVWDVHLRFIMFMLNVAYARGCSLAHILMLCPYTWNVASTLSWAARQVTWVKCLWCRWSNGKVVEWAEPHSPTLTLLPLRHSSFTNPSAALRTSQLILQPFRCFTCVTGTSPTSPGDPPMITINTIFWLFSIVYFIKRLYNKTSLLYTSKLFDIRFNSV